MTDWPVFLTGLRATEKQWRTERVNSPQAQDYVGWMPYDLSRFVMFLTDAIAVAPRPSGYLGRYFLDVGAGPGTKVLLARELFGLEAVGIEIVPEYVAAAHALGAHVLQCDARAYQGYHSHDIVYLNRPVQDPAFERHVMGLMRPGSVLITVNGMTRPPHTEWEPVSEEYDVPGGPTRPPALDAIHGVWRKPA